MTARLSEPTAGFPTVVDLLRWRALQQPDRQTYTFLIDGEVEEDHLTNAELDRQARTIGALLQSCGAQGERALLVYPPGLEFIAAFLGCLYAGAVAVPVYPPDPARLDRTLSRLLTIASDARPGFALTVSPILSMVEGLLAQSQDLRAPRWLATDRVSCELAEAWQDPEVSSNTLAFLQYTSGSTTSPKGVMVSHGNLLHNERMMQKAFGQTEQTTVVGWLPLYHDMGLIGNVLQPLYVGARCILMSPVAFLQRPFRWLQAISRYQAHTSGGPNFGYDLCVRKITSEQQASLDLRSWSVAYNGSEPVRNETLERFAAAFQPCGFRREAFRPCYGLAEATLFVCGGSKFVPPSVHRVEGAALGQNRVVPVCAEEKGARTLVGCGQPPLDEKVIIVNPESLTPSPPSRVGEIWVSGHSVAHGYWNRFEETEHTFRAYLSNTGDGPFLRTGDLGFLEDGEICVTGRCKDLIIIRGQNHYPQDIEATVEASHPALRPGRCAAFSVDVGGDERLVIAAEVDRQHLSYRNSLPLDVETVVGAIRQTVAEQHQLQVYAVAFLTAGALPKTSSGKIKRHACRDMFLARGPDVAAVWQASHTPETETRRDPQQGSRGTAGISV